MPSMRTKRNTKLNTYKLNTNRRGGLGGFMGAVGDALTNNTDTNASLN
jgi:hypothetical protein